MITPIDQIEVKVITKTWGLENFVGLVFNGSSNFSLISMIFMSMINIIEINNILFIISFLSEAKYFPKMSIDFKIFLKYILIFITISFSSR
jgi:hypothetical protein